MNEAKKTKLYTFDEMKDVVKRTLKDMTAATADDSGFDDPFQMALVEATVGAKLLSELDDKHKKGEI